MTVFTKNRMSNLRVSVLMPLALSVMPAFCCNPLRGNETEQSELQKLQQTRAVIRESPRTFQAFPKNSRQLRTENLVLQQRDFSCRAAALATITTYFWDDPVTESQILAAIIQTLTREELEERIENGLSLTDLKRLAERAGYTTLLGRLPLEKLRESKVPLLVGITVNDFNHFVVVRGSDDQFVYLADPAIGRTRTPIDVFAKQWQQNAVLAVVKPGTKLPTSSPLMVAPEERMRGISNTQWLRGNIMPRL
jgi:predicted double-glycine peptidase